MAVQPTPSAHPQVAQQPSGLISDRVFPPAQSPIHPSIGASKTGGPGPVPYLAQRNTVHEAWQNLQDKISEYGEAYKRVLEIPIGHVEYRPATAYLYDRFIALTQAHENFLINVTFHI